MAEQRYRIIGGRCVLRALERQGEIYHVRFRDRQSGRVYCRSTRERERRRAERAAVRIVEEWIRRADGEHVEPIAFAAAWENWLQSKPGRESTRRDQGGIGRVLASRIGSEQLVSSVTHERLQGVLTRLATDHAPTTLRKYLAVLRGFWGWAERCGYAAGDPTRGLRLPRGGPRLGVALSRAEAARLVAAAQHPHAPRYLHLALLLALHAGLRRQNVFSLYWPQVELHERRITIGAAEMKAGRPHVVPIHPELAAALRRRAEVDVVMGNFVLGRRVADPRGPFQTALRRAELPPMRWHDLRHTASTWWLESLPIAVAETLAARRLGGEAGTYAHIRFERLREAVDSLPWISAAPADQSAALGG